ncbi:conjugal transfer protein TraA, partial [Neisseria gonorrhoeae]
EGYLGMALGLTAFLIGLAVGLMKQTIMPCIVGLGVGLAATLGPGIIKGMFTLII